MPMKSAAEAFKDAGWEGDGRIGAIGIPPFMFCRDDTWGLFLWHVKQSNNGTSWVCADRPYEFCRLPEHGETWKAVEVNGPVPETEDCPFERRGRELVIHWSGPRQDAPENAYTLAVAVAAALVDRFPFPTSDRISTTSRTGGMRKAP
jgi:hypothetical protein